MRVLLALAALATTAAAPAGRLPVNIGGRVIAEPDGSLGFGWAGVYFESRFSGTSVRVRAEGEDESLRLLVDGREARAFRHVGTLDFTLEGLKPGDHIVRLEKQSESQSGGGRFLGFFAASADRRLTPPRHVRQIEFIGDSYTVGYGNSSTSHDCSAQQVHDTTDTQQAFGPLVARRFDADYRINAYSGFGIVRNYAGGSRGLSLPVIYPRLKPDDAAHLEKGAGAWHPQVIVINLGTNDFSTPVKAGEPWPDLQALQADYRTTYARFVRQLHARQPRAHIVLMGSEDFFPQVEQVAAAVEGEMKGRVSTLLFTGLDKAGCHYHPSLADDRKLADLISAHLSRLRPW